MVSVEILELVRQPMLKANLNAEKGEKRETGAGGRRERESMSRPGLNLGRGSPGREERGRLVGRVKREIM